MKNMDWAELLAGCFTLWVVGIIVSIFMPLLYAWGGYFTGWMLANIFTFAGNWVVSGAGVFGVEFPLTALPQIGAFLAFVGAFFKATQSNTNNKK